MSNDNAKRPGCSWDDNPWVWVVEYQRIAAERKLAEQIAFGSCELCPVKCESTGKMVSIYGNCVPKIIAHARRKAAEIDRLQAVDGEG